MLVVVKIIMVQTGLQLDLEFHFSGSPLKNRSISARSPLNWAQKVIFSVFSSARRQSRAVLIMVGVSDSM